MLITIMIFKLLNEDCSSIVEQIDAAIVERCQNPGPVLVEREPLHSLTLRFELSHQHIFTLVSFNQEFTIFFHV